MKTTLATIFALSLALVPAALAHHSQSEYDSRKKVEVEGTVSKVESEEPSRLDSCRRDQRQG